MDVSPTNIFVNWHSSLLVQFTVNSSHTILHMCSNTVHTTTCVMWFSLSLETVMHHSLLISVVVNIHFTWDWCTATSSIFFPVLDCWHFSAVTVVTGVVFVPCTDYATSEVQIKKKKTCHCALQTSSCNIIKWMAWSRELITETT